MRTASTASAAAASNGSGSKGGHGTWVAMLERGPLLIPTAVSWRSRVSKHLLTLPGVLEGRPADVVRPVPSKLALKAERRPGAAGLLQGESQALPSARCWLPEESAVSNTCLLASRDYDARRVAIDLCE